MTPYALTLHAGVNGKYATIGAVKEISVTQNMGLDQEYDINLGGEGLPVELIPQKLDTRTMRLQRFDLYTSRLEHVFGQPGELLLLTQQLGPINMRMTWRTPSASPIFERFALNKGAKTAIYEFKNCYLTSISRTVSIEQATVSASADLVWQTIQRVA